MTGKLGGNIDTAVEFNAFAHEIMPYVITLLRRREFSLAMLLRISVISGLSGLDLKGSTACASALNNDGVAMRDLLELPGAEAAGLYFDRLLARYERSQFPIFHLDDLIRRIEAKPNFELVWMTDDIIESYIDFLVIEKLLTAYDMTITVIPKNGRYGNDTSYEDACRMVFSSLESFRQSGRLRICSTGPLMAAANLRKLPPECTDYILSADALVLKGCRISEMFNGGVNAHTYVAFSVVRSITEMETGFSSDSNSALFFHLRPGEYAFWGVKGCRAVFEKKRVYWTLKDHFTKISSLDDAITRLSRIRAIQDEYTEDPRPLCQEIDQIAEYIHDYASSKNRQ